ncbi:putative ankyrin repeat protein [Botrytis fragariae]|uniref:Putative ankyrin repeat protein n=1 Tax=Botrytis fragariae TaxID=1964551 RepID=A0A8H6ASZ5_9HELO|nr:putative ankyrin repeat protein [Botrytis fragariae]KAF5873013.1 putative ankyrin repeat protein [Botrytis fragariae]
MTDPRDVDYEEEETPIHEQLISAIKYNSVGTFNAVLERFDSPEAAVEYLNTHALAYRYQDRDVKVEAGNVAAHVAASLGQDKIIDELLGQDGFECDPRNSIGDTPLHCAVRWINKEGRVNKVGRRVWEDGLEMIKMMLRDGSDPRIRNKDGHRAEDLVNAENTQLKKVFADFEYEPPSDEEEEEEEEPASKNGYDYADLVDGDAGDDDDVGSVYSGSDSEEEQEWQRRRAEKSGK